jgi:hypothetical protein
MLTLISYKHANYTTMKKSINPWRQMIPTLDKIVEKLQQRTKIKFPRKGTICKKNGTLRILIIKFLLTITKEPWIIHVFGVYCLKTKRCFIYLVNLIKSSMNQLRHFKGAIVLLHGKDINVKGNNVHRPTLA